MDILLTTPPLTVFEHMALDECVVRTRPQARTLRLYHWADGPAVTFGYAQFIRQVRAQTGASQGAICRRPTGGGIVFHQDDLTFSLVFPTQEAPAQIYKNLHASLRAALELSGVAARVFDCKLPPAAYAPSQHHQASACFVRPVENDLLQANGQKMLGGAIRRFGSTVLYQGSLQLPGARTSPALKEVIIQGVRGFWQTQLHICPPMPGLLQQTRAQALSRYQTPAWTEKF